MRSIAVREPHKNQPLVDRAVSFPTMRAKRIAIAAAMDTVD